MQDTPHPDSLKPAIKALPSSTVRQIGSTQVLVNPSSVVKELIDNALDARATAIFIDITASTVDSIQVKDNGHGIPSEDRALVCRRYCTSKIRDFQDLKEIGGKWLGFRGEAMASMAEVSGALRIWTRVEGEPVAVLLRVGGNGEITSIERASHPVGTTVKVNDFFKAFPVRKQIALDHSAKNLVKIKRLVQAYALARPAVRFGLRVLKAKTDKNNFVYAPKAGANVEDAAFKVVGRECASQCDWTMVQSDGFKVHAFLPRPDANGAKIANEGSFLSVDDRPVSTVRGTMKQVFTAYKERLRKANPVFASLKDPFLCMNIVCPPNSYDPNIEPAKDDLLFGDEQLVLRVVNKLLVSYYPQAVSTSQARGLSKDILVVQENDSSNRSRQWRSNMYGIDEEDMDFIDENEQPVIEDEEEMRKAAAAFNPWTLAKLNAPMKPRKTPDNRQLMTPAKGPGDVGTDSSSPIREMELPTLEPLTPQTAMRQNMTRSATDMSLERSIQRLPPPCRDDDLGSHQDESMDEQITLLRGVTSACEPGLFSPIRGQRPNAFSSKVGESSPPLHGSSLDSSTPQQSFRNQPFCPPQRQATNHVEGTGNSASQRPTTPSKRKKPAQSRGPRQRFSDQHPGLQNLIPNAAKRLVDTRLYSENNADIRDFLGTNRGHARQQRLRGTSIEPSPGSLPFFTPVNSQFNCIHNDQGGDLEPRDMAAQFRAYADRKTPPSAGIYVSTSVEPHPRSRNLRDQLRLHYIEPRDIAAQLGAYTECGNRAENKTRARSGSGGPYMRWKNVQDQTQIPEARDIGKQLPAYADRGAPAKLIEGAGNQENSTSNIGRNDTTRIFRPTSKHQSRPKSRRRSTLVHSRTKSSLLPLNHIPWAYKIQNVILPISAPLFTTLSTIANLKRKLNVGTGVNGLEWGYLVPTADSDKGGGVFEERVEEDRVTLWCNTLGAWWEKDGESAAGIMMEGIWGALSVRKRNKIKGAMEIMSGEDEGNGEAEAVGVEIGGDDKDEYGEIEDDEMLITM